MEQKQNRTNDMTMFRKSQKCEEKNRKIAQKNYQKWPKNVHFQTFSKHFKMIRNQYQFF